MNEQRKQLESIHEDDGCSQCASADAEDLQQRSRASSYAGSEAESTASEDFTAMLERLEASIEATRQAGMAKCAKYAAEEKERRRVLATLPRFARRYLTTGEILTPVRRLGQTEAEHRRNLEKYHDDVQQAESFVQQLKSLGFSDWQLLDPIVWATWLPKIGALGARERACHLGRDGLHLQGEENSEHWTAAYPDEGNAERRAERMAAMYNALYDRLRGGGIMGGAASGDGCDGERELLQNCAPTVYEALGGGRLRSNSVSTVASTESESVEHAIARLNEESRINHERAHEAAAAAWEADAKASPAPAFVGAGRPRAGSVAASEVSDAGGESVEQMAARLDEEIRVAEEERAKRGWGFGISRKVFGANCLTECEGHSESDCLSDARESVRGLCVTDGTGANQNGSRTSRQVLEGCGPAGAAATLAGVESCMSGMGDIAGAVTPTSRLPPIASSSNLWRRRNSCMRRRFLSICCGMGALRPRVTTHNRRVMRRDCLW